MTPKQQDILCDAQTSGGLLCAVRKDSIDDFLAITKRAGLALTSIGYTTAKDEHFVKVI
jgi:selenide,water dikinase